jgi:hypothetical protein|tara:strand:+ start:5977 stop:6231 length:255 start_codon:yes stop_codon:yes gene_type:complete
MIGKRKTSQFKTEIEATVRITVDHNKTFTEQQLLDEFSTNVSEDFHQVMSSDSEHLQPTQITVMSEKVIKSNGINAVLDVIDSN